MFQEEMKRIALVKVADLGIHLVEDPMRPKTEKPEYVSEFEMRRKTTGKKTVRFRVYSDEWLLKHVALTGILIPNQEHAAEHVRVAIERAALLAVRQVLDQL